LCDRIRAYTFTDLGIPDRTVYQVFGLPQCHCYHPGKINVIFQKCVPSMAYPGDGVDKDCNDETDELLCTEASNSKYMTNLVK